MYNFKELENLKRVKSQKIALYDIRSKDKNKNNVIFLINDNSYDYGLKSLFDSNILVTDKFKSFFKEKIYRFTVLRKNIKDTIDQSDIYKHVKENYPITRTYQTITDIKSDNVIIDITKYIYEFFSNTEKLINQKKVDLFSDLMDGLMKKYNVDTSKQNVIFFCPKSTSNNDDLEQVNDKYSHNIVQFISFLIYKPIYVAKLKYIDILLYGNEDMIRINLADIDKKSYSFFKTQISKFNLVEDETNIIGKSDDENSDYKTKEIVKDNVKKYIVDRVTSAMTRSFSGDFTEDISDDLDKETVKNAVELKVEEVSADGEIDSFDEIMDKLDTDENLKTELHSIINKNSSKSYKSVKRDEELREQQLKRKLKDKTLEEILKEVEDSKITPKKLKITTINPNMRQLKSLNYNKDYLEKVKDKDIINSVNLLKDKSVKVFIVSVDKEDTSDEFNKKETWTFELEDEFRKRHTLKFDVPTFVNNRFMYLGGNKKNILNQAFLKPIVKTGEDTVQVCTNYNKIFLTRYGVKTSPKNERLNKLLGGYDNPKVKIQKGNCTLKNVDYKTTIDFDSLAKNITNIKIGNTLDLYLDIPEFYEKYSLDLPKEYADKTKFLPIGTYKSNVLILNLESCTIITKDGDTGLDLIDFIVDTVGKTDEKFKSSYYSTSAGSKFMYTRATIMAKKVPLILLLGYCEGLTTILTKANIKYEFSPTRLQLKDNEKNSKDIVKFNDGYLIYDRYPFANSLLMNGLSDVPTELYSFNDFNSKDTYVGIFYDFFGVRNIANAFDNFYNLMIDAITKEVLDFLNLPTEFTEVMLYANKLLESNEYTDETNMNVCRVRNAEIISALVYKEIATAYERYMNTAHNNNPMKISVPRDAIIKKVLQSNIVEDYSTLNPMLEMERTRAISFKGPFGLNLEQAYTLEKRSFNNTMLGTIAMSSPPSGSVGVVRYLTLDPKIDSVRGFIQATNSDEDLEKLNQSNLFMVSELLNATSPTRDDSPRVAMSTAQSKHVIAVKKSDPALIGTGMEKVLCHVIGDDFAFKAKRDGEVIDVTENVMILQYDNGDMDIVDISEKIEKNGGSGIYISNKLDTKYKKGDKFKEDDVIAINTKFFKEEDIHGDSSFKIGSLQKIAIVNDYGTFEDSTKISRKLSKDMSSEVIMKKDVVLNKNANVEYLINKGKEVKTGETLILFEEGYDDSDVNAFLKGIGSELGEKISKLGKTPVKCKYPGVIQDVRIYYTVDFEELSPSLQKLITSYKKDVDRKYASVKKLAKGKVDIPKVDKIETPDGKVKGVQVDEGVLIEIYMKFEDEMTPGDKLTFQIALKSIVCDVFEEGFEPFSEFRPEEEISAYLGTRSVMARMTGSIPTNLFGNKVLVEASRVIEGIWTEDSEVYERMGTKYFETEILASTQSKKVI